MADWFKLNVLPIVGTWVIKLLGWTTRIQFDHQQVVRKLRNEKCGIIFAIWHGQQLLMPLAFREKPACVLISQHRDGEIIYRIIQRFGHAAVRGSTTRGGGLAFRQLIRVGRSARDIVVTPDGPKGPCEEVKPGIIHLAKMTGLPIVPLVFACSKKKSSQVGIVLFCRFLLAKVDLFGENRCGWSLVRMKPA